MALVLSGSVDISGSMTATTILISSPGAAGMVSSSAQITELAPLMAYTASLKGAAIVSSSQQVQNYFTFARTGSANTFYGNQTFLDKVGVGASTNPVYKLEVSTTGGSERIRVGTLQNNDNTARFEAITSNGTLVANSAWLRVNDSDGLTIGTSTYTKAGGDSGNFSNISSEVETPVINIGGDNVTIATGNLVMGTSGKGIDFSATSNGSGTTSSELLNDYEEGTWAPTVRGSGTAGTYELATDYTTYTKIGRQVTLNGQIKFGTSVTGGGTGYMQILGAPFTKVVNTVGVGAVRLVGINYTGDFVSMAFASLGATTTLFLSETVDNSTAIDLPISAAVANAEIQFTITYFV